MPLHGDETAGVPDIHHLVREQRIVTHFQPIHSVRTRSILGVEALSRGFGANQNSLIPPLKLAKEARKVGIPSAAARTYSALMFDRFDRGWRQAAHFKW